MTATPIPRTLQLSMSGVRELSVIETAPPERKPVSTALLERDKAKIMAAQTEGTYKARRLVYVAKADFGPRPAQGVMLTLDGKAYKVKSCTEEAGVLAIELEAVRS